MPEIGIIDLISILGMSLTTLPFLVMLSIFTPSTYFVFGLYAASALCVYLAYKSRFADNLSSIAFVKRAAGVFFITSILGSLIGAVVPCLVGPPDWFCFFGAIVFIGPATLCFATWIILTIVLKKKTEGLSFPKSQRDGGVALAICGLIFVIAFGVYIYYMVDSQKYKPDYALVDGKVVESYIYDSPNGYFIHLGDTDRWEEKKEYGGTTFFFQEERRDADYIYITDSSRGISIKLPQVGGMAEFSTDGGKKWSNFRR